MTNKNNDDQIAHWNSQSGQNWADDADKLDAMMADVAAGGLAAASPRTGETALDIGCGTGATALALADAVGPEGRVTGVDVSAPMLAVARARAGARANVRFVEADAAAHSFAPQSVDLVFSKFGVMFFNDPVAAFANIRKAVKPDGRLAFVCWAALKDNPFATLPMGAALKHLPPQPPADPFAPGPFAFADADRTRRLLETAGFVAPKVAAFETTLRVGATPASAANEAGRVGMASRLLANQPEELKQKVIADLEELYRPFDTPRGVVLPALTWVVTASV